VPLTEQYWQRVIGHCVHEIRCGRTPNPDVLCNSRVKFGAFYEHLEQSHDGTFDRITSGHYARVERAPFDAAQSSLGSAQDGVAHVPPAPDGPAAVRSTEANLADLQHRVRAASAAAAAASPADSEERSAQLSPSGSAVWGAAGQFPDQARSHPATPAHALQDAPRSRSERDASKSAATDAHRNNTADAEVRLRVTPDAVKDQTYFLAQLSQRQLSRALFPLGHFTKQKVRETAELIGLPTKSRKDSQGLCFLGKVKFSEFIKVRPCL
jgi:tRNA methyl transferase